jgi:oleate hydratase
MLANYVDVRFGATATDADFTDEGGHRRAVKLRYTDQGQDVEVDLGENDYLFMTLGSIRADSSYAGRISVPELIRDRRDGGWAFWDTIARKAPDFGRPATFYATSTRTSGNRSP